MKKVLLLTILITLLTPFSIFAGEGYADIQENNQQVVQPPTSENEEDFEETTQIDENTKKVATKYFDLTLERRPQSAFGNHVPYVLTIKPHLDSPRTQILWNTPSTLEVNSRHAEFVDLEEGETYTFRVNIKPLRAGTYDFSASVISWQHDTNYTNSIDDTLTFDRSLVLQPVSSQYQIFNVLKIVIILILFIVVCIIAVRIVKRYMVKAKKWLTPPY
jgi:hypothetical protein